MSNHLETLSALGRIEENIKELTDRFIATQQALRETLPYAEDHWSHNPEIIKRWRELAGYNN